MGSEHPSLNDHLPLRDAVERAAHHLGQAVALIGQYDLGAEGAYRVTVGGTHCVFKYWSGERAAALHLASVVAAHDILRPCGWPLPSIHFWRSDPYFAFVIEAQMSGSRVIGVTEALCRQLLTLLAAVPPSAGDANADTGAWLLFLEQSLHFDLPISPCRPRTLERTALGRRFVARARRAFAAARPALAAARDVIHGDFSAGNVLCDDAGALAAVDAPGDRHP